MTAAAGVFIGALAVAFAWWLSNLAHDNVQEALDRAATQEETEIRDGDVSAHWTRLDDVRVWAETRRTR